MSPYRAQSLRLNLQIFPRAWLLEQTVRYFNQATGYDGAPYAKKTSKAMCDELGDVDTMREAVETAKATLVAHKAEL